MIEAYSSKAAIIITGVVGITIAILEPPGVFDLVVDTQLNMGCAFLPNMCVQFGGRRPMPQFGRFDDCGRGYGTDLVLRGLEAVTGFQFTTAGVIPFTDYDDHRQPVRKAHQQEMRDLMGGPRKGQCIEEGAGKPTSNTFQQRAKAISQFCFRELCKGT